MVHVKCGKHLWKKRLKIGSEKLYWEDIIKRKRGKPKREPYNPFTGTGTKPSDIAEERREKLESREQRVKDSQKKVPRARVARRLGGGSGNFEFARERLANSQGIDVKDAKSLNPKNKCAMCGITLGNRGRFQTATNAADLRYCNECARIREGKPVRQSYRFDSKGNRIASDNPKHRRPTNRTNRRF
ncbi:MAG: hypothetical protein GOVbin1753_8 [Prokaryotic dsDNA virus sp.]|nr:MAG: hypothetical protein GOVbin1753_8 [Prokaryotic dsDNA virus sp.]|tara:strand:+ start:3895 stop:4455 length:561 start_codon:yes stop_codon:yes gene_type:complete